MMKRLPIGTKAALAGAVAAAFVFCRMSAEADVSAVTYPFTATSSVMLEDMSSGTTQLIGPDQDNAVSAVQLIGFDFWFNGIRYSQFSVNSNGLCRLGNVAVTAEWNNAANFPLGVDGPKVTPYFDDLWIGTNGKAHFKVLGTAPNRKLVVEWLNMQIPRVGAAQMGGGTFQMWLFETTGVVELVYGPGISTNTANGGYSVGLKAAAANNFASVTTSTSSVSYAAQNNTQTDAITAGTAYLFTPNVPNAPSNLTFTAVTPTSITLNWMDNATNEVGYGVYQSTDNVNFSFVAQTAADATSYQPTSLMPATNYFFKIVAVSEGGVSSAVTGSQTTLPASVSSTAAGGNWSAPATWANGAVPTADQDVTITDGSTVTIDMLAVAKTVTVGTGAGAAATLVWDATTGRSLTTGGSVMIASNGTFQSPGSGSVRSHQLVVGTDLTNNGVLNFSTNSNNAGANITFTGASNNTFGGSGATTNVRAITINKGTSSANILELNPANFTVQGSNVDGPQMAFLSFVNGTFKISGTFTMTGRVFTSPTYTIPATCGFWLNNANFTVAGQNNSATNNGLLRISQGTFNLGTAVNHSMDAGAGAVFTTEGGSVNLAGRLNTANAATYTQTGGAITLAINGNTAASAPSFGFTSASSVFNMSGGTITLVQSNSNVTPSDYRVNGTANITGGALTLGTAATTAVAATFRIGGSLPGVVVDNTVNAKGAIFTVASSVFGNTILNTGTTLNLNGFLCTFAGNITNNGTLIGNAAGTRLYFNGSAAQTYSGAGTITGPLPSLEIDNINGLTIDPGANQIVTLAIVLFNGGVTHANKLTLGNGGSTSGLVQIGSAGITTNPGALDVAPVFNIGTGGEMISYLQFAASRDSGPEINPGRLVTALTRDIGTDPVAGEINVTGGNLTVTGTLTLTNGRITTGSNTLILTSAATLNRTNGYVDGNLRKTFTAADSKTFEVGTIGGYGPAQVNNAAGTFPADVTVASHYGRHPNYSSINGLRRYWTITAPATLGADLVFRYNGNDTFTAIPGGIGNRNENNFKIAKYTGAFTFPASTPDGVNNQVTVLAAAAGLLSADWMIFENADADFDGMPDAYEMAHTTPASTTSLDPTADADGDGMSNLLEYNAGTDPNNGQSNFRITSIVKNAPTYTMPNVLVTCTAVDGKLYRVDYKNALTDPTWIFLRFSDPHTGQPTAPLPDVTIGTNTQRFYRARFETNDQF